MTKQLKMRQKSQIITGAGKTADAAIKQLVTKEFQIQKPQIEEWKQKVKMEVVLELQNINQAHIKAIEI